MSITGFHTPQDDTEFFELFDCHMEDCTLFNEDNVEPCTCGYVDWKNSTPEKGKLYRLHKNDIFVVLSRVDEWGAECVIVGGNVVYPRGGHNLWISIDELQNEATWVDLGLLLKGM